jgi:uncharacterized membrane protein YkoI
VAPSGAGASWAMTTFRRLTVLVTALAFAALSGTGAIAEAGKKKKKAKKHQAALAIEKAREIALAEVPGVIRTEELEKEDGRWIYSFVIKPTGMKKKLVKEVNVDADTGAIVDVETERE